MKLKCFLLFISLFFLVEKSEAQRALTNLPTLYIDTTKGQTINRDYIEGTLRISTSSGQYATQSVGIQIRGRGNSTWNFAKKPYRIKLNEEAQLLGMPAKNHLQLFEDALFFENYRDPETGYRAYTDSTTLIDWYIASELTGNPDCFWSTYIYKRRNNDRIFWGPLWDYDIAFNNDNRLGDATYKLMRTAAHNPKAWINRL